MHNSYLIKLSINAKEISFGQISIDLDGLDQLINTIIKDGLKILISIIIMYISIKIGNILIKKFVDKQIKSNAILSLDTQRAKTLGEVLKSVLKYAVYFLGITSIITVVFNGISFTFASIGGLAVGFGAQSLVKDLINGFFILFEDQFGVGDYVTIGNFNGIVTSIGIRTTIIKAFTGDIHCIPNGSIVQVTNHSRSSIRFTVDVDIAYEEDVDNAINIISLTCKKFEEENKEVISGSIDVLGVISISALGVTIRVIGKAEQLKQWDMERELRKKIKTSLDENGVLVPYPQVKVVSVDKEEGE